MGSSPGCAGSPGAPGLGNPLPSQTCPPERAAARLFCHVQCEWGGRGGIFLSPRGRYLEELFWHHCVEKELPAHLSASGDKGVPAPGGTREEDAGVWNKTQNKCGQNLCWRSAHNSKSQGTRDYYRCLRDREGPATSTNDDNVPPPALCPTQQALPSPHQPLCKRGWKSLQITWSRD